MNKFLMTKLCIQVKGIANVFTMGVKTFHCHQYYCSPRQSLVEIQDTLLLHLWGDITVTVHALGHNKGKDHSLPIYPSEK